MKKRKSNYHKDTKSHNVNIKVMSGTKSKLTGGFEITNISKLKKDMIVYPIYGSYAGKKVM